jgi:glycosyltransferase involved in cell wall biosynthesis
MKSIQYITVHPTHYHDFFIRELVKSSSINLNVHYLKNILSNYPWKTEFRQGYQSRICKPFLGIDWYLIKTIFQKRDSFWVISGWAGSIPMSVILTLIILRRKYAIYTDTPNFNINRNGFKSFVRNIWIKFIGYNSTYMLGTGSPAKAGLEKLGIEKEKIKNFPFFVDLDYFKPLDSKNNNQHYKIFSSGRLVNSHKGYDFALKALSKFKQNHSVNFEYYIAGEGEDRKNLEDLILKFGLEKNVFLLGWKEPDEIMTYYQTCDLFIHPCHFDPFPNAVLEAMACGCVVLASTGAGSALDRIEDGKNGFLFEDNNEETFLEKLNICYTLYGNENVESIRLNSRLTAINNSAELGITLFKSF